jgi:hypothetical protein
MTKKTVVPLLIETNVSSRKNRLRFRKNLLLEMTVVSHNDKIVQNQILSVHKSQIANSLILNVKNRSFSLEKKVKICLKIKKNHFIWFNTLLYI